MRRHLALGLVGVMALVTVGAILSDHLRSSPPSIETIVPADPDTVYDPVDAGEPLPEGYRTALDRDDILPVYDPEFTTAEAVDWPADTLVIGVAVGDTTKAYPVTHLNSREMVNDSIEGTPILVSW